MGRVVTQRNRRWLYVAASMALIASIVVFARSRAEATSSVSPTVTAAGIDVYDAALGNSVTVGTQLLGSPYGDGGIPLLSLTRGGALAAGSPHDQVDWASTGLPGLPQAAGVMAAGNTGSWDDVQIAAVQSAIWHFTQGFEPLRDEGTNSADLLARFDQLVAAGSQNPVAEATPSTITLTALDSPQAAGLPVRFRAEGTAPGPWTLKANSTEVSFSAATADGCSDTPIDALSGPGEFCATSSIALDSVTITVDGQATQGTTGRVFVAAGSQALIGVTSGTETPYDSTTAAWSQNLPPVVQTYCPTHIVIPGDPSHYSLYAYDPEGEALTIQWYLDGVAIPGDGTTDLVRVAREEGQSLTVTVTDASGNETTMGTDCPLTIPTTTTQPQGPTTTAPAGPTTTEPTGPTTTEPQGPTTTEPSGPTTTKVTGPTTTQPTGPTTTEPQGPTTTEPTGPTTTKPTGPTTTQPTGENRPPVVTVECRNANPDELATFLATATDPDDDDIAGFTWRLNGQVVDGETADALQIRVAEGDIVTVTATDSGDATSAQVQAPCTPVGENQPPTVTVECRGATVPGQEATFLASAIDPNGDEIASYTWMVNDNEVTGQNGPSLTVIVNEGDVVTVTATDTGGAESTEAAAPCTPVTNNEPPEVTIDCPDELVDGREATFRATGTDPDGDDLTYTWFVDGRPVADVTGDQLTITWTDTTNVSVQVTDANGASSDVVASDCGPDNEPPAVAMECLGSITPGARAVFSATATDPDGDTISFSWFVNDVQVPGISGPLLSALVEEGDVITVVATDARGAASAPVEAPCAPISENEAPSVTVDCPDSLTPGEEATFTATGTDPDGEDDNLVYTWFVNDVAQTETGDAFTFVYSAGDEVAVKVTDEGGTSTVPETADCTEQNEPPTVSLICQGDLTPGEPATFLADGNDPEGGELTYRWLLNDRVVPGQTGPELRIVVQLGDVISIVASDEAGLDSEEATAPCTPVSENAAPEVTVECPPELSDGEEAVFTATGTDPDGDELIYTWYVNGDEVDDQNGPTLTVTYSDGDRISVRVTDTDGASSDEVTAECTDENRPPTVRIDCPAIVVFGEPTRLVANGTDPDGDRLSYIWKRNGEVVDGATGSVLTTIVDRDDRLTVTVLDGRGGMSAETSVDCNSGSRPRITVACPPELTFGKPAEFVATVTDEDGDSVENGRITVVWKVDGKLVTGTSGSSATLTLKQGQRVDVAAIDASGLVNAAMEPISCTGIVLRGPGSNGGATNGSSGSGTTAKSAGGSVAATATRSGTGSGRSAGATRVAGASQAKGKAGTLAVTGSTLLPWLASAGTLLLLGWVFKRESSRRRN